VAVAPDAGVCLGGVDCDGDGVAMTETRKAIVERLHILASEAKKTVQPERFWDDVLVACRSAQEAAFHLSETLADDRSGPLEYAAGKFLQRWDGRA
jgi:hypothetical protein